ncbi:MAG TPA: tol-pal system-associated acyl-CoA thioesterase [Caulobacteraceae bacterium]|jgi:acyl-CoA thioester hydrolase|nr:tol-pal system-associated acyl-CoA thioesterase [Caulobacteraceae bacterium]
MTQSDPSAGRFEGREHRLPVRVYYEDTDFTGVVYHASYARFFERGRTDFLRLAGIGHGDLFRLDPPLAFVVVRLAIDFIRPAAIDDALEVRTVYRAARGARFTIDQRLWRGDEPIASAEIHAACIELSGRPRRLPAQVMARLEPYLSPAA